MRRPRDIWSACDRQRRRLPLFVDEVEHLPAQFAAVGAGQAWHADERARQERGVHTFAKPPFDRRAVQRRARMDQYRRSVGAPVAGR